MNKTLGLIMLIVTVVLVGCADQIGDYMAAASISKDGFAIDGKKARELHDQEVKIWGFVDHSNLYGDAGAKDILDEWWSGDGPTAASWRFNLKARENDEAGHSFAVHIPNDAGRDSLLKVILADARTGRPTRVFLKGKLFTFDAPTSVTTLTGLYMELESSRDILLDPPRR